jgi:hypothetical protein
MEVKASSRHPLIQRGGRQTTENVVAYRAARCVYPVCTGIMLCWRPDGSCPHQRYPPRPSFPKVDTQTVFTSVKRLLGVSGEIKMRTGFVVVAATVFGFTCAVADDSTRNHLQGDTLKKAVSGKTVRLATPLGTLPIQFRMDGSMSGTAGELAAYTGSAQDSGRWWVNSEKLCQRWRNWLNGQTYCFTLRQEGRLVHWVRNDGLSGKATILR